MKRLDYKAAKQSRRVNAHLQKAGIMAAMLLLLIAKLAWSVSFQANGAPAQQAETYTDTLSPTASLTATPDVLATGTLTVTAGLTTTVTPSLTTMPTQTHTPTLGVVVTFTPTFTAIGTSVPSETAIPPTRTATPTFLPMPQVTMIYPKITATPFLLMAYRRADTMQKQRLPFVLVLWVRFWPLGLMFLVWGILVVWFILIQRNQF